VRRGRDLRTPLMRALALGMGAIGMGHVGVQLAGASDHLPAPRATQSMPQLNGTWAWEGTDSSGLAVHGARLATLILNKGDHGLSGTLRSGTRTWPFTSTFYHPEPIATLKRRLPQADITTFSGSVKCGSSCIWVCGSTPWG
jgi:hypothetical protein